jgi:zona occludens toxin (predicted ATPase)
MGAKRAERSAEVAATPDVCFETAVDYETVAEWQRAAKAVDVIERYPDGLGRIVDWHVDLAVRELRYRLEYSYEPPHTVRWDFVEGDMLKDIGGGYRFVADGEGRTIATYEVSVQPAIPVPGFVARRLERELMKRSVDDLRREVERRAGV